MGGVKRERENFMRRFAVSIVAATVSVACGPIMGASAAPMVASSAICGAADNLNLVERAQFIWLGRNYCWYDDGWNGPGWYWCGQYTVPGIGFGGGYGWHHWRGGHPGGGHPGGGHPGGGHPGGGHPGGGHPGGGHPGGGHPGGGHPGGGHPGGGHGGGGHGGGGHGGGHHSDIRLKEDIVPLARLNNGIELYRFRYKGRDHTAYVGVMAQEVQNIEPSAVSRDRDGYLMVNYDRLGLKFMTWDKWLAGAGANIQ